MNGLAKSLNQFIAAKFKNPSGRGEYLIWGSDRKHHYK